MKRLCIISCALAMLLLLVGSASAEPPIHNSGVWTNHEQLPLCDFPVYVDSVADYNEWYFFDRDGNVVEWRWHGTGTDTISAPSMSDVVLTGQFSLTEEFDVRTNTFKAPGVNFSITIPGHGAVLFEAGLGVFSEGEPGKLVGIHLMGDPEKMAILCGALAGE